MDNLDVIQFPTLTVLSSSSNNQSSDTSNLPKTIKKTVRKKLYKRTIRRSSSSSSSPRRSSTRKSSPPFTNRRHKWSILQYKEGKNWSFKGRSRKAVPESDTTPSSAKIPTPYTPRLTSSVSYGESLSAPQSTQSPIVIDSEHDEDPLTPSPIRNSPLYGRRTRRQNISFRGRARSSSSVLYRDLPTETPKAHFMPLYPELRDDTTTDMRLIERILKGPTAEQRDRKRGLLYTAGLEGETRYIKIGYTDGDLQTRMNALSSPRKTGTVYSINDLTPGGQSRFLNSHHAEQIIHLELYNRRHRFIEKNQCEWFKLEIEEAHRVCRKWRNWFRYWEPYDEKQQLKEFWRERITRIQARDPYDAAKHGSLHQRWNRVLNPTRVGIVWRTLHRWQTWLREQYLFISAVLVLASLAIHVYGVLTFILWIVGPAGFVVWITETNNHGKKLENKGR
ncbi:hypothetical protein TSTA_041000 [Talaromyces stipitatus ATCC 10500]|uniref:Bacteriophage T5 Orf172 DNA-binding domain-containing protein n=1 Tax=Talaromyces stipitatus (strain ATCC 10500 / CBS 375.48 / QM 6759 / NRRL 1006) TaxID=441959 RepID=B8MID7_TALSN|nr:uncharacterized protein TSTA_041000 [Talaromyces stipitatus ATCC 10500]EED14621.1 hypothetical protein TSTA_041000 [Talaromyces stipitatus ATCC 10500]